MRNKKDDLSNLIYKIKQYILLDRMKDPFIHKARVSVIQIFKDRIKKNQRVVMLKKMLPERNDKNGHDTILKYLGRWKLNAEKLRERQNKFKKALETIEKRNLIDKIKIINAACLMKKLFSNIPKIKCPTLLVWGTLDEAVDVSGAYELEGLIKDAGVVIYENCTHYAYLERLGQTINVLNSFLKED